MGNSNARPKVRIGNRPGFFKFKQPSRKVIHKRDIDAEVEKLKELGKYKISGATSEQLYISILANTIVFQHVLYI